MALSTSEPSAKKRRRSLTVDSGEREPAPPISRSTTWFDDGSVILQAESTQFKDHRTVLVQHSLVFTDMFTFPQPSDDQESSGQQVESCPVVHVFDTAEDVTHLLSALYNNPSYNPRAPITFPILSAILRLSSKYEFKQLREDALFRLKNEIPTSLEQYEAWRQAGKDDTRLHMIEYYDGLYFDMANLAYTESLYSFLPILYLTICFSNIEDIYDGIERGDGTIATLQPDIRRICILKRNNIVATSLKANYNWVNKNAISAQCTQPAQCAFQSASLLASMTKPSPGPPCILIPWEAGMVVNLKKFCEACRSAAKVLFEDGKQRMWNELPGIFGLPSWEELRNMEQRD